MKQSKFRHIEGSTVHKSLHIENLRNVSQSMPGESDGFHANLKYCAIPMSGSAGVIAIIQVNFCSFLCLSTNISHLISDYCHHMIYKVYVTVCHHYYDTRLKSFHAIV